MKNKIILFAFICIACISIVLRLYNITAPIADWHSFRQVDTASVARIFVERGIDFLHPRYHDLSNIQSGKDNPEGWRMVEFPLYQGIAALFKNTLGMLSIEVWLRFITIFASTATALLLGIWVKNRVSVKAGLLSAFVYAVLPYSMFYGRIILPDPLMVFFSIGALTILDGFGSKQKLSLAQIIAGSIFASLAVLVKPYAVFLLLPILPILWERKKNYSSLIFQYLFIGILTVVPFLLWRKWIAQFPEGIPVSEWLLNGNGIRFKGSWFEWLFAERIGKLLLGFWGLIPFGFGLITQFGKNRENVFTWLLGGSLLYLIVVASGNVQHDYYQIALLPILCIYVGKGFAWLIDKTIKRTDIIHPISSGILLVISFIFMEMFGWFTIRTYYWINKPEIVEAGKMADEILPKDAKVIAPYMGDTTFLYQTGRTGWPLNFDIEKKRAMGATHYVTVSPTDDDFETKSLASEYTVLFRNDKFAIIDLTQPKVNP